MQENINNNDEYVLFNVTENYVRKEVAKAIASLGMCSCNKCFVDICAIVLNKVQCRYSTSNKGALLAEIESIELAYKHQMYLRIIEACKFVKEHPKH